MTDFPLHTAETAPAAARPLFENSMKAFGMVPNLHAVMAESPELLEAYQAVHTLFSNCSLGDVERNVVWMAINVENACHYCVPAHSAIAKMQGVSDDDIESLRNATPLADPRLEALRLFTVKMVRQRGLVDDKEIEAFLAAGFTKRNILDVVLGIGQKVMSNYTNHLAQTPVDAPFEGFAWSPAKAETE